MKAIFSKLMDWMDKFRKVAVNLFMLLLLLIFLVSYFMAKPAVPDRAVLVFEPKGRVVEQLVRPDPDAFPFSIPDPNQVVISDVVLALKEAAGDERIKLLELKLDKLEGAPLAKLQDLRKAIEAFKKSGKPVVAAGSAFSQSQYYLAATANRFFLHPMGMVGLTGLSVYQNYLKSALDKLSIDIHLFRAGEYKSAGEPLIRDSMSPEDREANRAWLATLWDAYKADIATMRGVKAERIQTVLDEPAKYIAEHKGSVARLMLAEKMVDELADQHDVDRYIAGLLGDEESDPTPGIDISDYLMASRSEIEPSSSKNLIGIIRAAGPIIPGEQPTGTVGGDTVADLLRDARMNDAVKAVVLRIDSPGGSAVASEVIRKEVARVRESGKPVIVSMGSVAASGGYWIASAADEIWSQPTTLTGSIGVFGIVGDMHRGLEKLGIHSDGIGTTRIAGGMRADRPLHPELAKAIQMGVDEIYREFIDHVADGRKMEKARVEQLAKGRVWSGVDAHNLGLVDKLGDLNAAVAAAAGKAGVADDFRTVNIEPHMSFADFFIENLLREEAANIFRSRLATIASLPVASSWLDGLKGLELLSRFNDPRQIYLYSGLSY